MPPQLLETDEEEQAAIRDALLESLRLEEKARIRETLALSTPRVDDPPEFTPEQRAEKAAATRTRLIEERAQSFTLRDVQNFTLLNPKRGIELGFSGTKKFLAERLLFPKKEDAPGFFGGLALAEKEEEAILAGVTGFAIQKAGGAEFKSEALLRRSAILFEEVERQLALEGTGVSAKAGKLVGALVVFILEDIATRSRGRKIGTGRLATRFGVKKRIKRMVLKYAAARKLSKKGTKKLLKRVKATPQGMVDLAAVFALDTGLHTFASTGDFSETAKNATVSAAVGGGVGLLFMSVPILAGIYKEARVAAKPRLALGLPKTGPVSREQLQDAAIATINRQKAEGASIPEILQTVKNAETIAEREGIAAQKPSVVSGRPGAPEVPRPIKEPKPQEIQREQARKARKAPTARPEAPEARFRPPEEARTPQEEVKFIDKGVLEKMLKKGLTSKQKRAGFTETLIENELAGRAFQAQHAPLGRLDLPPAAPPVKGRPARPPLLRPAQRTPQDPPVTGSEPALVSAARQTERTVTSSEVRHLDFWRGRVRRPGAAAEKPTPRTTPIWVRSVLVPAKRAFRKFKGRRDQKDFLQADNAAPASLIETLAKEIEVAKPLRGVAEGLKSKELRKRAARVAAVQKRAEGRIGVARATANLKGELPTVGFEPIGERFTAAQQDALLNHVQTHHLLQPLTRNRVALTLLKIFDYGHLPTLGELTEFQVVFGPAVTRAMLRQASRWTKLRRVGAEMVSVPRTLLATLDLSATLRQGFSPLLLTPPKRALQTFGLQLKAFADEDVALAVERSLGRGPRAKLRIRAGLELTKFRGEGFAGREEAFLSEFAQNIPIIGVGVRASNRAFVTFLNKLRADLFDAWAAIYRESGLNPSVPAHFKYYRQLADFINAGSGRGKSGPFQGPWWNLILFSPRFLTSRFEHLFVRIPQGLVGPPAVRRLAMRQLVAEAGIWLGMAAFVKAAAKAAGAPIDVDLNPRSTDFLKVRLGKRTFIDLGAGYGQVIRLMARSFTGARIDPITREAKDTRIAEELQVFLTYKLSPVPSAVSSISTGRTPSRDPATFFNILEQLALPISIQNAIEVSQEHGAQGISLMVPEILGLGVQIQKTVQTQEQIQKAVFRLTEAKLSTQTARSTLKSLRSRGITLSQLRIALRAEATRRTKARVLRRQPPPTAAGLRKAIKRALSTPAFKLRLQRLQSLSQEP